MDKNQTNINLKKKASKNRDVVILYASLLLSCVVLYFLVRPLYMQKTSLESGIILKNEDLRDKKELLSNVEKFNSENSDLAVDLDKLTLFISKRNDYEEVISYLNNMATENNLAIDSYSVNAQDGVETSKTEPAAVAETAEGSDVSASATSSAIKKQAISLEIKGDYANFTKFLKALENGVPFFQEGPVNVSAESKDSSGASGSESGQQVQGSQAVNTNPTLSFKVDLDFVHY